MLYWITVTETQWTSILKEQPRQGEKILAKTLGGQVRIITYDRFNYAHWAVNEYKRIPDDDRQRQCFP